MRKLRQRDPRQEDAKHLAFVRAQPCCVCGSRRNVEAAHLRMACPAIGKESTGMQEKPHDKWTTPLCNYHHQSGPIAQHKVGEDQFWRDQGRNPFAIAADLWARSGGIEREIQPKRAARSPKLQPRKPRQRRAKIASPNKTIAGRRFDGSPIASVSKPRGLSTSYGCCGAHGLGVAFSCRVDACEPAETDAGLASLRTEGQSLPLSRGPSQQIRSQLARHSTCSSSLPTENDAPGVLTEACLIHIPRRYPAEVFPFCDRRYLSGQANGWQGYEP